MAPRQKRTKMIPDWVQNSTDHESLYFTFTQPRRLSWFRFCAAVYLLGVNLLSILSWETLWKARDGDLWYFHFFYFSNWTLMTATIYFCLVSVRVLPYEEQTYGGYVGDRPILKSRKLRRKTGSSPSLRDSWEIGLLSIALPASILTSVVYWAAIFSPDRVDTPLNYAVQLNVHLVVMVLMLVDTALNQFSFKPRHCLNTMAYGIVYHLFATCLWSYTGWWIYPFLDWTSPGWLAVYVTQIAFFFFTCLLQKLRDLLFVATTPSWLQEILEKLSPSSDSNPSSPSSSPSSSSSEDDSPRTPDQDQQGGRAAQTVLRKRRF